MALIYGDLFMRVLYKTKPYEKERNKPKTIYKVEKRAKEILERGNKQSFDKSIRDIIRV